MRQTTVLIAQLSTAAGIRAPLSHVADQVFIDLTREIERQGVRQKVVADMFGLALRTYQRKVQRLLESRTDQHRTLWEAVLSHVAERGPITRGDIDHRFRSDDALDVAAVLKDLVSTGLAYRSGDGQSSMYRATSAQDRETFASTQRQGASTDFVWLTVFHHGPVTAKALDALLPYDESLIASSLETLVLDGRVDHEDGCYRASTIAIPVGAQKGWEAAVFDHFQAMVKAIGAKLESGQLRSQSDDTVGGATLTFDIYPGHPLEHEVRGLLKQVRTDVNDLWERVEAVNAAGPIEPDALEKVPFYFGQGAPGRNGTDGSHD